MPSLRKPRPTRPQSPSRSVSPASRERAAAPRLALRGKWELLRITSYLTPKTSNLTPRLRRFVSFRFKNRAPRGAEQRDPLKAKRASGASLFFPLLFRFLRSTETPKCMQAIYQNYTNFIDLFTHKLYTYYVY